MPLLKCARATFARASAPLLSATCHRAIVRSNGCLWWLRRDMFFQPIVFHVFATVFSRRTTVWPLSYLSGAQLYSSVACVHETNVLSTEEWRGECGSVVFPPNGQQLPRDASAQEEEVREGGHARAASGRRGGFSLRADQWDLPGLRVSTSILDNGFRRISW